MKKINIIFLMGLLFVMPLVSANFTPNHEAWTLTSLNNIDSGITDQCRPFSQEVADGNTAADVFVLFYFSSDKQVSYIFTHQRSAYNTCLEQAGADIKKKCFCYGMGSHIVQDAFAHNMDGLVPKYLESQAGLNFIGHMVVENSYLNKWTEMNQENPIVKSGALERVDSRALDSIFDETGGDSELLQLLKDTTKLEGVNVENTARIFRSGYQNEGFFNSVYKDRIQLPFWTFGLSISLIIAGFLIPAIVLFFGDTRWRFFVMFFWVLFLVAGIVILSSLLLGNTWKITTFLISQPPKIGYLQVSDEDIKFYDIKIQQATDEFFKTGILPFDDASGISDRNRALIEAEGTAKFIAAPIFIIILLLTNIFLFMKSFGFKFNRFLNITGISLSIFMTIVALTLSSILVIALFV